jgi:transcriptional regulator GlxA family with amidase domain
MKHISILIPEGDCSLTHIEATHQILNQVNGFLESMNKPPLLSVQLVGLNRDAKIKKGLFTIYPDKIISEVRKTDLIIIPAIQGEINNALAVNQQFVPWLKSHYLNGAELASFCLGSFLLASTGLLNGRKSTTHWSMANDFRGKFPEVELIPEKIITDDAGIYTSGGALSFQNLIIYLVEKYAGRDIAILTSKTFMIDIDRDMQSPFIIFKGQKEHDDKPITKVQEYIEKNIQEKITVDQLAEMASVSRRNFERRFKKATSNSVIEYIQRVRVEAAKKSFETTRMNINEVMYNVGYTDLKAFRTTFKKITGLSPLEYRNKYNPRMAIAS